MNKNLNILKDEKPAPWLSPLSVVRLMVLINQTRGILRPTAHQDLRKFINEIKTQQELEQLLEWGDKLVKADYKERYFLQRNETKQVITGTQLKIFRKPEKAFQIRWMYRPSNWKAASVARLEKYKLKQKQG